MHPREEGAVLSVAEFLRQPCTLGFKLLESVSNSSCAVTPLIYPVIRDIALTGMPCKHTRNGSDKNFFFCEKNKKKKKKKKKKKYRVGRPAYGN